MKALLALALLVSITGCVNMPKIAKELAKDDATVSIKVNTIYGTASFFRAMPRTNSLSVSPDGTITQGK